MKICPHPSTSSFPLAARGGGGGSDELKQKILEGVQAPQGVPPGSVRIQLCSQEEQLPVLVHRAQRQSIVQLRHAHSVHFVLSAGGGKRRGKNHSSSELTASGTWEVSLTGIPNSDLNWKLKLARD